jgi:hypothetical protein
VHFAWYSVLTESTNKLAILPVPNNGVEADDQLLLLGREPPSPDVRSEVVDPPQPATLPASL